jgi:hypothetical protein
MLWKVNFFDKNSDETRTLTVEASDDMEAEEIAENKANELGWNRSFRIADAQEIE